MQRLRGSDAVFLYRETPTSLMHTLKVQILSKSDPNAGFDTIYRQLKLHLNANPDVRLRILPVPFGLHHPVLIEDPDFSISSHVFHVALPPPGTQRELDKMVAQIGSTLLDRSRPLWEIWVIEGLSSGEVAVVHKIHHAMADGKAYLGLLTVGWKDKADSIEALPASPPLPSGGRLMWGALVDHVKYDAWNLWPLMKSFVGNLREIIKRHKASKEPRINPLSGDFPRTRFNYALGVKRGFASCQLSLSEIKALKDTLGVTLNDVVLAIMAGAVRSYFIAHNELPDGPLATSVPVGADDTAVIRRMGNRTSSLFTLLHTEIEDPLERLYTIRKHTEQGKEDLAIFGKHQWADLMQYVPPNLFTWSCQRKFRLKPADGADFRPNCNIVVSNVPGPREKLEGDEGALEALYSAGVLGEGMGLSITVWSYMDQLNVGILACDKAMPDIERLRDAIPVALEELQQAARDAGKSA